MATIPLSISLDSMATNSNNLTSTTTSSSSSSSNRGKWSAATIGTIISAPIRGYYYPGRVKAIKKTLPPTPTTTPTTTTTTTNTTNTSNSMLPKDLSPSLSDNHANNQQQQQLTTNNANNNNNGQLIYSIQFTNPLDSYTFDWMDELGNGNGNDQQPNDNQSTANNTNTTTVTTAKDQGLILDYTADQLIGRGFEPITRALLSENQKVFITYRNRECSAHVLKHDTDTDDVTLVIDSPSSSSSTMATATTNSSSSSSTTINSSTSISSSNHQDLSTNQQPQEIRIVRLNEIRLLPSRKSARIQEHPDYSLLASNGRRSPDDNLEMNQSSKSSSTMNKSKQSRQRNQSGSSILLTNNSNNGETQNNGFRMNHHHQHQQSAHIDVPQQQKLNHFGHSFNQNNSNNIGAM